MTLTERKLLEDVSEYLHDDWEDGARDLCRRIRVALRSAEEGELMFRMTHLILAFCGTIVSDQILNGKVDEALITGWLNESREVMSRVQDRLGGPISKEGK